MDKATQCTQSQYTNQRGTQRTFSAEYIELYTFLPSDTAILLFLNKTHEQHEILYVLFYMELSLLLKIPLQLAQLATLPQTNANTVADQQSHTEALKHKTKSDDHNSRLNVQLFTSVTGLGCITQIPAPLHLRLAHIVGTELHTNIYINFPHLYLYSSAGLLFLYLYFLYFLFHLYGVLCALLLYHRNFRLESIKSICLSIYPSVFLHSHAIVVHG